MERERMVKSKLDIRLASKSLVKMRMSLLELQRLVGKLTKG